MRESRKINDEEIAEMVKAYSDLKDTIRNLDITETEGPSTMPIARDAARRLKSHIQKYERLPKGVRDSLDISDRELDKLKRRYS